MARKKKMSREDLRLWISQIIIYSILAYIFVFLILKAAGVIKTPLWVELSPAVLAIIMILIFIFNSFEFFMKFKDLPKDLRRLSKRTFNLEADVRDLKRDSIYGRRDHDKLSTAFYNHLESHK